MGTSLVFLGQGVLASLERARAVRLARAATAVQRRQRGRVARAAWRRARGSAARIQYTWRSARGRKAPPPSLSRERTPSESLLMARAQTAEPAQVAMREAETCEEELVNLEADNSALVAANGELQSEVLELVNALIPTKLRLAHAEDEKAAMLRELRTLAAKLAAAETELEQMRQAAASRAGNFGLFAARR
jgi:myosin heavy subunit